MGSLSLHQKIGLFLVLLFHAYLLVPVEAASGMNKWEATNFCKCICYGTNFTILRLDLPDNPSQPCMSCTKQWCLNQNLPICAGAKVGDTNPDTATGKEGDVEARCFLNYNTLYSNPMGANQSKHFGKKGKSGQTLGGGGKDVSGGGGGGKDVLGGGGGGSAAKDSPQNVDDPRVAAAEAAERRLKAQQERGTNASNPKQGQLAAQAARQKSNLPPPSNQKDDRLVWD
ncbi:hypothetical protein EST38_g2905 [Candolleomyces aberdarensis]|uniref:Uncharacterized protein n=1 Tax=Candolleomyces aberdarensis TaxID=2316362 RepID=A0A4Q2DUE5_9AGAR|nr:hypothetical protein EST38_g2905 [Candolleomyces aberdarensis]